MKYVLLLALIAVVSSAFAQGAKEKKTVSNFFQNKTKIDNPFELRDPFKAPSTRVEGQNKRGGKMFSVGDGQYSNIASTDIASTPLHSIRVVGVLIGKERRALTQVEGQKGIVVLKEGMHIGPDKAELKAILPGGIVLVEKIVNVYGQEEYLETVIPISR